MEASGRISTDERSPHCPFRLFPLACFRCRGTQTTCDAPRRRARDPAGCPSDIGSCMRMSRHLRRKCSSPGYRSSGHRLSACRPKARHHPSRSRPNPTCRPPDNSGLSPMAESDLASARQRIGRNDRIAARDSRIQSCCSATGLWTMAIVGAGRHLAGRRVRRSPCGRKRYSRQVYGAASAPP